MLKLLKKLKPLVLRISEMLNFIIGYIVGMIVSVLTIIFFMGARNNQ